MKPQHKLLFAAILALVLDALLLALATTISRAPLGSGLVSGAALGALSGAQVPANYDYKAIPCDMNSEWAPMGDGERIISVISSGTWTTTKVNDTIWVRGIFCIVERQVGR